MLRRLGYRLGLTRETRRELSNLVYENAVVISKEKSNAESIKPRYVVQLEKNDKIFRVMLNNKNIFESLNEGDTVNISYVEKLKTIYDYIPPNFEEKKPVKLEERVLENALILRA